MKTKRILQIILAVLILLTQTVMAKDYSDYPQKFWDVSKDHWAYEYISELVDKNVISGHPDGSFKPEDTVLRAEWSKMLVVASGKQPITLENNKSYAVDYNSNDWYYGYINSVVDYMNFYNDGGNYYFKPNQSASREDVTVSLVKLKGYSVDNVDYSYISKFKDSNSISNDLKKYIAVAIEKELISGYEDNTFRGQDTLTRAEAATLLCRAFQLGNDNKTTNSNSVYLDGSSVVNSGVNNEIKNEESNSDFKNKFNVSEPSHKDEYGLVSDLILISVFQSDDEYGIEVRNDEREKVRYSLSKDVSIKRNGNKVTLKELKIGDELDILISYDEIIVNIQAYSSNNENDNASDNTIINNTTINNTTINNNVNGTVNVNNGTINNNVSADTSKNEGNNKVEGDFDDVPEEIEEEKLPYKIETLVKADIKNEKYDTGPINYITIRDDDIYYLVDNTVYILDTDGRGYNKVFNLDEGINMGQDKYVIKNIYNLYYDRNGDRILAYGYARKINSITGSNEIAHIIIDVENNTLITDRATNSIQDDNILSMNDDGDYWTNENGQIHLYSESKILGTKNSFSSEEMNSWDVGKIGFTFDMNENSNDTYFMTNGGIYKYDYSEFKNILETDFNPIAALKNGFVIQTANGDFKKVDFNGKISNYINISDIEIKDKKSMITPKTIMNKMFINSNNDIIVYDLNNKCFRIISEN